MCIDQTHPTPTSPILPLFVPVSPLVFLMSCPPLLKPTESSWCCLYVHRCGAICYSVGSLPGHTSLKKKDTPTSHQLPITG